MASSLTDLVRIARALGPIRDRVVFIGGSIASLLQQDPPFPRARATSDVDAVLATTSYSETFAVGELLADVGFKRDLTDTRHIHRWRSPDGIAFDLVPAGEQIGGSGSRWDDAAIATAISVEIEPGLTVRHASATAFLALKWAAYDDRGANDPLASHDMEDIIALLASRPSLANEVSAARHDLRGYVAGHTRTLLDDPALDDILAAQLNNADNPQHSIALVGTQLRAIAALPTDQSARLYSKS